MSSGAMDTISEAHQLSMVSELRANVSTSDPGSTLEQSANRRQTTERSLTNSQRDFDRKHERNMKKLDKLSTDLAQLDLSPLSEQVQLGVETQNHFASFLCHFYTRSQLNRPFALGNVFFFSCSKKLRVIIETQLV